MSVRTDPGLHAVERVRGVTEAERLRDLQRALAEERAIEDRLAALNAQLRAASQLEVEALTTSGTGALIALRSSLVQLNETIRESRADGVEANEVTRQARQQWEHATSQLSAVEQLLERRATERRQHRDRVVSREADDLAGQAWIRRTAAR